MNGTIKRAGSLLATTAACAAAAVAHEQPPSAAEGEVVEQLVVTARQKATALDVVEARMEQDVVTDFRKCAQMIDAVWKQGTADGSKKPAEIKAAIK